MVFIRTQNFRTLDLEIDYLTLKLQIRAKHRSNNYIIPALVLEIYIKTKIIPDINC